jgi:hypothetical protein
VGAVGTIVMWAAVVAAFCLFAASILYIAGRLLPLRPRKRR